MSDPPSTHGGGGRQADGRFAEGNRLGRGNPLAGRAAKIRAVLLRRFTPAAAAEIVDALIGKAKKGDLAAIRELLDRTIGKPTQAVELSQGDRPAEAVVRSHKTLADLLRPTLGVLPLPLPPGVPQPDFSRLPRTVSDEGEARVAEEPAPGAEETTEKRIARDREPDGMSPRRRQ
jgi:hypothetical protein